MHSDDDAEFDDDDVEEEYDDDHDGDDDRGAEDSTVEDGDAIATSRDVVEYLARSVVEHTDEVRVEVQDRGRGPVRLDVFVDRDDMGRVIGKRGRVANSIRTIVRAAASRDDVEVEVEFVD